MSKAGVDPRRLLNTYVALYNDCLRGKPDDMLIGLHVCRGNIKVCICSQRAPPIVACILAYQPDGSPFTQGAYDWIAERLFTGLDFDCFYVCAPFAVHMPPHTNHHLSLNTTRKVREDSSL